ncbi:MAG TPA: alpha/beta hydrolase [Spirochaetota bacterium]|nr:alpha/beta hydrolase [Spirochaetota bacterium]
MYKYIDTAYGKIGYIEVGEGENNVLFLHGMTEDSLNWFYTIEYINIRSKNFKLIAIDLPGFGKSSVIGDISIPNYALAVKEFLSLKNIEKTTIVGHSLGGQVAVIFANYFKDMVDSIILVATAGMKRFDSITTRLLKSLPIPGAVLHRISLIDLYKFILSNDRLLNSNEYFRKLLYEIGMTQKNKLTDIIINRNFKYFKEHGINRVNIVKKSIEAMLDERYYINDKFKDLKMPIFLIWGEKDYLVPERYGREILNLINHESKELFILKNTGHYPMIERPKDFTAIIFKILTKVYNI